jgi:hypothetical protein
VGMEDKSDWIAKCETITAGKKPQKPLHAGIHPESVPVSVNHECGIRLLMGQEEVQSVARRFHFQCVQARLPIYRCVAAAEEKCVAFTQRHLQRICKTEHHLPARLRPACLETTQMTCRDLSI